MILITGVTGLLGSALAEICSRKGEEVVGVCRCKRKRSSLDAVDADISIVECDIVDRRKIRSIICSYEPEIVIHLAAQPIVSKAYKFPIETFESNFNGTVNVFEACEDANVKTFILGSTDKVYGNCYKATENMTMKPVDLYAMSKAAADFYVRTRKTKMNVLVTRPCNIYGYDLNLTRLIPYCITSCMKRERPVIRNPNAKRQYLYSKDYARAMWMLIEHNATGVFNIGSFNVLEASLVAAEICEKFKIRPELNITSQIEEAKEQSVNFSKLVELGWYQKYTFYKGIEETIDLYKKHWR